MLVNGINQPEVNPAAVLKRSNVDAHCLPGCHRFLGADAMRRSEHALSRRRDSSRTFPILVRVITCHDTFLYPNDGYQNQYEVRTRKTTCPFTVFVHYFSETTPIAILITPDRNLMNVFSFIVTRSQIMWYYVNSNLLPSFLHNNRKMNLTLNQAWSEFKKLHLKGSLLKRGDLSFKICLLHINLKMKYCQNPSLR